MVFLDGMPCLHSECAWIKPLTNFQMLVLTECAEAVLSDGEIVEYLHTELCLYPMDSRRAMGNLDKSVDVQWAQDNYPGTSSYFAKLRRASEETRDLRLLLEDQLMHEIRVVSVSWLPLTDAVRRVARNVYKSEQALGAADEHECRLTRFKAALTWYAIGILPRDSAWLFYTCLLHVSTEGASLPPFKERPPPPPRRLGLGSAPPAPAAAATDEVAEVEEEKSSSPDEVEEEKPSDPTTEVKERSLDEKSSESSVDCPSDVELKSKHWDGPLHEEHGTACGQVPRREERA